MDLGEAKAVLVAIGADRERPYWRQSDAAGVGVVDFTAFSDRESRIVVTTQYAIAESAAA